MRTLESFALQADDTAGGSEGDITTLPTSSNLTSDVVATQLVFTTQPAPLMATSGVALDFTADPVVEARDANGTKDAGFTDADDDDLQFGALVLPEGAALTIAKGQRVVVQSHYINMSPEPRTVMDAVDLELTTVDESPVDVDAFAVVDSDLAIPVGVDAYERVKTCTVNAPMAIHMMLGHTHDYGVLFDIEFIRGGVPELQYHATHGPTLRDTPEILMFDDPLQLDAGDQVRVTCAWTNTTDHVLGWPEEMCVALMYYSPGQGYLICDTDDETPVAQDGGESDPEGGCIAPGTEGNDLGVGRYCTVGGGECDDTPEPTLCLAEFDADATYCSVILCQDDSVCGEGATCVFEGPGSACVPLACQ